MLKVYQVLKKFDSKFIVLVDDEQKNYSERSTSIDRTVTIPFNAGSEEIEIIGTMLLDNEKNTSLIDSVTVDTDRFDYIQGDDIFVTGTVRDSYSGTPISLILKSPDNDLVLIQQLEVESDKTFSSLISEDDISNVTSGLYTVTVQYGTENRSADTSFVYTSSEQNNPNLPCVECSADTTVIIPKGLTEDGCQNTRSCYDPYNVNVKVGDTVTWINYDNLAHTVTSGSSTTGLDGLFDSGLFQTRDSYEMTFYESGTYPYFCMVHPWMEGIVIVGEGSVVIPPPPDNDPYLGNSNTSSLENKISKLERENSQLQAENRKLKNNNNGLQSQIEELHQKIDNMQDIIMEQIKVIMEGIAELKNR